MGRGGSGSAVRSWTWTVDPAVTDSSLRPTTCASYNSAAFVWHCCADPCFSFVYTAGMVWTRWALWVHSSHRVLFSTYCFCIDLLSSLWSGYHKVKLVVDDLELFHHDAELPTATDSVIDSYENYVRSWMERWKEGERHLPILWRIIIIKLYSLSSVVQTKCICDPPPKKKSCNNDPKM